MAAGNEIDSLHARTNWLCGDRADPALAALVSVRIDAVRRMFAQFGVNFEVKLDDVAERLYSAAQDFFAVGLGADPLTIVSGEQELKHCVLVV
jgi:hypothetical protein